MSKATRAAYGLDSGAEVSWRLRGACASGDWPADWWTTSNEVQRGWATYVCLGCPVRVECDAWARAHAAECVGTVYAGVYYTRRAGDRRVAGQVRPVPHQPRMSGGSR